MGKGKTSKVVVRSRSEVEGLYQLELVRCGKERCTRCAKGAAHGPYWYLYRWDDRGARLRSLYIGKKFKRRHRQTELQLDG